MELGRSGIEPGGRAIRDANSAYDSADCGNDERLVTLECADAYADDDGGDTDADGDSADPTSDSGRASGDANYRVPDANAASRDFGGLSA